MKGGNHLILLTGGTGRLGTELRKILNVHAPSHSELDITQPIPLPEVGVNFIIHSAAYTNVAQAEIERQKCFEVNVIGTENLVSHFGQIPFIYISSEYAHNPVNFYAHTKREGERKVERHPRHLILRTLFKSRPFPYDTAYVDQFTQGDYVDVIAKLIVQEIERWDGVSKMKYVGTGRKTIFDLARQTKPNIRPISIKDIKTVVVPGDYL